ncbi:excinuclease ABC subunit B [Candidatus Woesearchaeota archaeon]|nr:MAG: excinuclease ABC subunit B [Candidatus Woesearchaeota archaeon]
MDKEKFQLKSGFEPRGDQPKAIAKIIDGLGKGFDKQTLLGVTGSGKTFTMANVIANHNKPTLVLAHNKTLAAQLYHELKEFFPNNRVEYFVSYYDYYQPESYLPRTDTYIEKDMSVNPKIEQMRLSATQSVLTRNDVIIVSSVSCIYGLGDPKKYNEFAFELQKGQKISRKDLLRKLLGQQYERNDKELTPGKFRVKGDTIDVIPAYQDDLLRIEMWGDEIEKISFIDPFDFVTKEKLDYYYLFPARHFVTDEESKEYALQKISEELEDELPKIEDELVAHRLKQRITYDMEMIQEIGHCKGIENYSRHFDKREAGEPPKCLLNYFPEDFLFIIDESHQTIPQIHGMYKGDRSRKQNLIDYGFRLPSAFDNRPLKWDEFKYYLNKAIFVSATPANYELDNSKQIVEQIIRPTGLVDPEIYKRPIKGQMTNLIGEIEKVTKKGFRTLVTTLTKRMAEELTEFLSEKGIRVRYLHSEIDTLERTEIIRQLRSGDFDVLIGINLLREGIDIPEVALVAILDADKEGFLRNERSLIQIIGRAARNSEAKVILYMDNETDSIKAAINETNRRREIQIKYNKDNNIIPKTIIKPIKEAEVELKDINHIAKNDIPEMIESLTEQMNKAADDLNFEAAIFLRDKIDKLKKRANKKD